LVPLDDSIWASYAFNYATLYMNKQQDHLYLLNVCESSSATYIGYATSMMLSSMHEVEDKKARKILVHYGHKAKILGIHYTMMKGTDSDPGSLICKIANTYKVHTIVMGRRSMGAIERFFVGSNSKHVVENAECNVIVVKSPVGPEEEHDDKRVVILKEEEERIRRMSQGSDQQEDKSERKKALEKVHQLEEEERKRRMEEEKSSSANTHEKLVSMYKFQEELRSRTKGKDAV